MFGHKTIILDQYSTSLLFLFYHSFIILEYIMKNTGTVCIQVTNRSLPQEQLPWLRSTSRESSPRENGGRVRLQRQCYNCGKGENLATKTDKKEARKIIFIQTANISNSTFFIFTNICYFY